MAMDVKRFEDLKSDVEKLQRDIHRSEGALTQQKQRLKQDFDCDSVDEAETMLEKMKEDCRKIEEKYNEKLEEFEQEWKGQLDE
jgi:hypothetical protein